MRGDSPAPIVPPVEEFCPAPILLTESRLALNPCDGSGSLGIESGGTNYGELGNALFHSERASAALT